MGPAGFQYRMDDSAPRPLAFEDLLANLVWIQWLAVYLLKDQFKADDAVQRLLVKAEAHLPRPDLPAGALKGWVRRVLQNVIAQDHRSAERRRGYERRTFDAARVETATPSELVEWADTERHVLEAAETLPVSQREVLLMSVRQFKSPQEIARELNREPGTVRSQLKRAREAMIKKLGDDYPDWVQRCLILVGFPAAEAAKMVAGEPVSIEWTGSKSAMALPVGLAAAAVAVALVTLLQTGGPEAAQRATAAAAALEEPQEMSPAAPRYTDNASSQPRGSERDELEFAGPGAEPDEGSDEAEPAACVAVVLRTPDGDPFDERIPPGAGYKATDVTVLVIDSEGDIPAGGLPLTGWSGSSALNPPGVRYRPALSPGGLARMREGPLRACFEALPDGGAGILEVPGGRERWAVLTFRNQPLKSLHWTPGTDRIEFTLDPADLDAYLAQVSLRVVDAVTLEPLQDVSLHVSTLQGYHPVPLATDVQGRIEIAALAPGRLTFQLEKRGYGGICWRSIVRASANLDLGTFPMQVATRVRGTVVDEHGRPIAGGYVSTMASERYVFPYSVFSPGSAETDARGAFAVEDLPPGEHLLFLTTRDYARTAEWVTVPREGLDGVTLRLGPVARVRLLLPGSHLEAFDVGISRVDGDREVPVYGQQVQGGGELDLGLELGSRYRIRLGDETGERATLAREFTVREGLGPVRFGDGPR